MSVNFPRRVRNCSPWKQKPLICTHWPIRIYPPHIAAHSGNNPPLFSPQTDKPTITDQYHKTDNHRQRQIPLQTDTDNHRQKFISHTRSHIGKPFYARSHIRASHILQRKSRFPEYIPPLQDSLAEYPLQDSPCRQIPECIFPTLFFLHCGFVISHAGRVFPEKGG